MEKSTTKTDLEAFIAMIQNQSSDPNSLIKAKNIRPAMELKMFIADLDDAALQWVCYFAKHHIIKIMFIIITDLSKSPS